MASLDKKPTIMAVCLARGGSKGIPRKNIRFVGGKPLLAWCVDAAIESKVFDKVYVSTDSLEIARISAARGYNIHERDPSTATDGASSESGVADFLRHHPDCDICCLLQATSPMTTAAHIAEAYEQFQRDGADSLVTVVRTHRFMWKVNEDGTAGPMNYDPVHRPRRQDWNGGYIMCHKTFGFI